MAVKGDRLIYNDQQWVALEEHAQVSFDNSLLRIERMKLREGLKEALDGWVAWIEECHGEGAVVIDDSDRIAELRKLLLDAPQQSAYQP